MNNTITESLETGEFRTLLVALRDKIAAVIDEGCSPRDLVGSSRRLIDLAQEVRALDAVEDNPRLRTLRTVLERDEPFDPAAI
jgi:hypothetical protein